MQDEVLVRGLKRGLISAQERFYKEFYRVTFSHSIKILFNVEDAEDATQRALYKAMRSIGKYKGKAKLKNWLYKITRNESFMLIRRMRRHKNAVPLEDSHLEKLSYENLSDPYLKEWVNICYFNLPDQWQIPLELASLGYNLTEGAQLLDFNKDKYKSRFHRAKQALKRAINE